MEDSAGAVAGARDLLTFTREQREQALPDAAITVEEEWWVPAGPDEERQTRKEDGTIVAGIIEAVRTARTEGKKVETIIYAFDPSGTVQDKKRNARTEAIARNLVAAGISPVYSSDPPDVGGMGFSPGENVLIVVRSVKMQGGR